MVLSKITAITQKLNFICIYRYAYIQMCTQTYGFMVGLYDLKGLFQPKCFYDSVFMLLFKSEYESISCYEISRLPGLLSKALLSDSQHTVH